MQVFWNVIVFQFFVNICQCNDGQGLVQVGIEVVYNIFIEGVVLFYYEQGCIQDGVVYCDQGQEYIQCGVECGDVFIQYYFYDLYDCCDYFNVCKQV